MIELRAGDAGLTIDVERGGRLASLRVGGEELLVNPPDATDRSIHWGCFLMAPWPGRLAGGRVRWRDSTIQLPINFGRNAVHGLVHDRPWTVEAATLTTANLACDLPLDLWPMGGRVRHAIRLSPDGLELEASIEATNAAMPAAIGWHPWFRRRHGPRLRLKATGVLETRRMLPTGRVLPIEGKHELRDGPRLGRRRIDDAFVGVRAPVVLTWADLELAVSFDAAAAAVVLYTPWNAVCIEPQTALPNALSLPDAEARAAGRRDLEAGETLTSTIRLAWRRLGG